MLDYPNETNEYRIARDALLKEEQALVDKVKAVAQKRRELPMGGQLKEDYIFQRAIVGDNTDEVKLSELFGDKETLLLYSMMYGPDWDSPCLSCTSLVDGFDRTYYSIAQSGVAFAVIAKASAEQIGMWAKKRHWSQIPLISGLDSSYQADYKCIDSSGMQRPMLQVFVKRGKDIFHFWGSELPANHVDTVWAYWNLMDFTPQGRPNRDMPPQDFRCEFLESHDHS